MAAAQAPEGEPAIPRRTSPALLRFTHDSGTTGGISAADGLSSRAFSYLRARDYDPEAGRFLSNDPLGGGYPYAGNNPVGATDPSGLLSCSAVTGGASYSSYSNSGGSAGCYDASGNVLYCEGTCPQSLGITQSNTEAAILGSAPTCICASEEVVQDLNTGGAPLDNAAQPVVVAVKESAPSQSGSSPAGTSSVNAIRPPPTGTGGCKDNPTVCATIALTREGEAQFLGTNGCVYDANGTMGCEPIDRLRAQRGETYWGFGAACDKQLIWMGIAVAATAATGGSSVGYMVIGGGFVGTGGLAACL